MRKRAKKTPKAPVYEIMFSGFYLTFPSTMFSEEFMIDFCCGLKTGLWEESEEEPPPNFRTAAWRRGHSFAWKVKIFCRLHDIRQKGNGHFEVHIDGNKWRKFHALITRTNHKKPVDWLPG